MWNTTSYYSRIRKESSRKRRFSIYIAAARKVLDNADPNGEGTQACLIYFANDNPFSGMFNQFHDVMKPRDPNDPNSGDQIDLSDHKSLKDLFHPSNDFRIVLRAPKILEPDKNGMVDVQLLTKQHSRGAYLKMPVELLKRKESTSEYVIKLLQQVWRNDETGVLPALFRNN